jgi:nitrite reductase/ring-hydroxylating ferredoxin subunit
MFSRQGWSDFREEVSSVHWLSFFPQKERRSLMMRAPTREQFAPYPASWYRFGAARELRDGPVTKTVLGRPLVAFRTARGQLTIMTARCSHLGANLGGGQVVGETIQCPFHGWRYGTDGQCVHVPATGPAPAFARQACYPAVERHGSVYFFNGPEPLFPLPFFPDEQVEDFVAGKPFQFVAECSWYMVAAHAFDTQHFVSVHDRRLLGPPRIDCPAPFARRNQYSALVEGRSIFDRLLRRFAGPMVHISITTWAGTFFLLKGAFRRSCSYFLITSQPLEEDRTLIEGIVFSRRTRVPLAAALLQPLSLWVRRLFTHGYLIDEAGRLGSPRYRPACLIDSDRDMIDYFHWAASLPQAEQRSPPQDGPAEPATIEDMMSTGVQV